MRRLVVWNLMTLDGYFEGEKPWELDFHLSVWGDELETFVVTQANEVGTLLFGRKTYEGMAAHWTKAEGVIADFMNGVEKVVASRTLRKADWNNSRLLEGEVTSAVAKLKQAPGKDIFIFGSAELSVPLLGAGLVDEYRLCIAPVVLGAGSSLFKKENAGLKLSFQAVQTLKTGGVIMRGVPQRS